MDILKQFPMVAQIMYSEKENNPLAYDCREDDDYKKAYESAQKSVDKLTKLLLKKDAARPCDYEELKEVLYDLETSTGFMENGAEDYGFIHGFKTCAKLLFEMLG